MNLKQLVPLAIALIIVPSCFAAMDINFARSFETVGQWLAAVFNNEYATFGVVMVLLMILLHSIYAAGLKKVPIFEGSGGEGLSRSGNTLAWMISALSVIGLYYLKGNRDVGSFLRNVLGPSAIYGGIAAVAVLFMWLKKVTGSIKWAVPLAGVAAMAISNIVQWPMLATIGLMMVVVGLFSLLFSLGGKIRSGSIGDGGIPGKTKKDLGLLNTDLNGLGGEIQAKQPGDSDIAKGKIDIEHLLQITGSKERERIDTEFMIKEAIDNLSKIDKNIVISRISHSATLTQEIIGNEEKIINDVNVMQLIEKGFIKEEIKRIHKFKEDIENLKKVNDLDEAKQKNLDKKVLDEFKWIIDIEKDLINKLGDVQTLIKDNKKNEDRFIELLKIQNNLLNGKLNPEIIKEIDKYQKEKFAILKNKFSLAKILSLVSKIKEDFKGERAEETKSISRIKELINEIKGEAAAA